MLCFVLLSVVPVLDGGFVNTLRLQVSAGGGLVSATILLSLFSSSTNSRGRNLSSCFHSVGQLAKPHYELEPLLLWPVSLYLLEFILTQRTEMPLTLVCVFGSFGDT